MENKNVCDVALGEIIAKRRKELGLTQTDLSEKLGIKRPTIACYEKGIRAMNASLFFEMCDVLYLKPNDVANRVREMTDEK